MKNVHCNIMATTSGRRYEADCWITWHKTKHIGSKSGGLQLPRPTVPCKNEVGPQSGRKRVLPGRFFRVEIEIIADIFRFYLKLLL